jgi:mRNA-degrading endonuclease RelE of RelBE toxin-antitoxin system
VPTDHRRWDIVLAPAALKDLGKLGRPDRERIVRAIDESWVI